MNSRPAPAVRTAVHPQLPTPDQTIAQAAKNLRDTAPYKAPKAPKPPKPKPVQSTYLGSSGL